MSRVFQKIVLPLAVATLLLASSCLPGGRGGQGGIEGAPEGRRAGPEQQPTAALLTRGAQLYDAYCLACHGGATGGGMMDMPPRHNANGHTWHHPDCQLVDSVLNGSGEMGEIMRRMMGVPETAPRMPAFKGQLTEDDAVAILTYIKTWWTQEQRVAQARLSQRQCR